MSASREDVDEIPFWLHEICDRLADNDPILTHLNLNIRTLTPLWLNYLVRSLTMGRNEDYADDGGDVNDYGDCDRRMKRHHNAYLSTLNLTSCLQRISSNRDENTNAQLWDELQLLVDHPTLSVLHLSHNGLVTFPVSLSASYLVELHLEHNALKHPHELVSSLRFNPWLRILQLNGNHLGDEICIQLASILTSNTTLQIIGLRRNRITSTGIRSLENVLHVSNRTVHVLDVSDNRTSRDNLCSSGLKRRLEVWCRANRLGRQFWDGRASSLARTTTTNTATEALLWPKLLSRLSHDPDVMRLFLQLNPHALAPR